MTEALDFTLKLSFEQEQFLDKLSGLSEVLGILDEFCRGTKPGVLVVYQGYEIEV